MRDDAEDLVYASEDGGGGVQGVALRDRLPSSDEVRAMIEAAFEESALDPPSSGGEGGGDGDDGGRGGSDKADPAPPLPQDAGCAGGGGHPAPGAGSPELSPLSGLGGLGASEAVNGSDSSGGGVVSSAVSTPRRGSGIDGPESRGGSGVAAAAAAWEVLTPLRGSGGRGRVAATAAAAAHGAASAGACPKWSEALRSPSKGEAFSPSKDMNRNGNLHGLGLTVAVDRAKSLSRCGKRCANLLADVAALNDALAQSMLKSCKSLGAAIESGVFPPPVAAVATELRRSLVSFAKQTQGLSICVGGSVARPLHGSASAMADTVPSIFNRYALTRAKAFSARQNAIRMRVKYVKAVRRAEEEIRGLRKAKATVTEEATDGEPGRSTPVSQADPSLDPLQESTHSAAIPQPSLNSEENSVGWSNPGRKGPPKAGWEDMKRRFVKNGLSKSSEKVIKALDDVQAYETHYCKLVEEENHAVSRSQTMEVMALEALQKLEEERLQFFIETLGRALQAEKGALDNMMLTMRRNSGDSVASTLSTASSNASQTLSTPTASTPSSSTPSSLFTKLKATPTHAEEGSSVNEALALNMPETVGRWRDSQRRNLSAQLNRTQAVRVFSAFFEEIASAAITFGTGLNSRLANDGYAPRNKTKPSETISLVVQTKPSESLAVALNESEGDRALSCWNKMIESLGECAKSATDLGFSLQKDGRKLLDKFLSAEKELKVLTENEEMRWKQCCDAARDEAKARSRLEQSVSDLEKARQRLTSAEEGSRGKSGSSVLKKNPTMTKALGNMFSMLPEEAMTKMLAPDQRLAIVKRNLQEAEGREQKDKAAYESAQVTKEKAIASYTTAAQTADSHSGIQAESVWGSVNVGIEVTISLFQHFRESRYDCVEPATAWLQERGAVIETDMAEWTKCMQENISKHLEKEDDTLKTPTGTFRKRKLKGLIGKADGGYSLQVHLEDSKSVYKLLDIVTSETDEAGADDESGGADEVETESVAESEVTELKAKSSCEASSSEQIPSAPEIPRSQSGPTLADSTPASTSTKELLSLAAALKDSADRPAAEKSPVGQGLASLKSSKPEPVAVPSSKTAETELFLAHFWEGGDEDESTPPTVIESFSCAYWPKEGEGFISPLLHGRLFATSSAMYFIGWGDKKIVLKWEDSISVTKETIGMLDNSLRVTYDSGEGESSYFFGSFAFRENAFRLLSQLSTVARSLKEIEGGKSTGGKALKAVPPDEILKKMNIVLKKKIKNVSVKRYYENCWSEGNRTDAAPFYVPFLEKKKNYDIKMSDWDFADDGPGFEHKWSGEKFDQKRVVTFKFKRTTHLYVGPPVAGVTQTQYCRLEDNDRCVLAMTVEMNAIPYADCFAVEVRWVTQRVGENDVSVEVGVFVDFKKSSMFTNKIRTGTVTEAKPLYQALFEATKEACMVGGPEGEAEEGEEEEEEKEEEMEIAKTKKFMGAIISFLPENLSLSHLWNSVSGVQQSLLSTLKEPGSTNILLVVGFLILLSSIWQHFPTSTGGASISRSEFDALTERMDNLNDEMREIQDLLHKIFSAVAESKNIVEE